MVSKAMSKPFFVATSKSKPARTAEALDIAARYFVYRLYEETRGQPVGTWHPLGKMKERAEVVARAVERGWISVGQDGLGKARTQGAALTDEGRPAKCLLVAPLPRTNDSPHPSIPRNLE